jgi:predicted GIY-YIG superfamily endonuclease
MFSIYVLLCKDNKYYVGKTHKLEDRIIEHFKNNGAEWTRLHSPLEVVKVIETDDAFDEDKWTKRYMKEHGMDNVRGGSYSTIKLSNAQLEMLRAEFRSVDDLCFRCGESGHFINQCPKQRTSGSKSRNTCYRCGRTGHWVDQCYAMRDVNGIPIMGFPFPINPTLNRSKNSVANHAEPPKRLDLVEQKIPEVKSQTKEIEKQPDIVLHFNDNDGDDIKFIMSGKISKVFINNTEHAVKVNSAVSSVIEFEYVTPPNTWIWKVNFQTRECNGRSPRTFFDKRLSSVLQADSVM